MKSDRWPVRPVRITDLDADAFSEPDSNRVRDTGIISHSHLQGIQSAISDAIGYPTTVVEFSSAGEPVRTDSPVLNKLMNPACAEFRAWSTCCEPTDAVHAQLLRERGGFSSLEQLQRNVQEAIVLYCPPERNYGVNLRAGLNGDRVYLSYDCRMLGYRELAFPIVLEGKLLAVFFVGQIPLADNLTSIAATIKDLPDRLPACLNRDSGKRSIDRNDIATEILTKHKEWISDTKRVLTIDGLEVLIGRICNQLDALEEQLADSLRLRRQQYIGSRVREVIRDFRKELPHETSADRKPLDKLWSGAKAALETITQSFALKYIILFGVNQMTTTAVHRLHVVARVGATPDQFTDDGVVRNITLDLDKVNAKLPGRNGDPLYASRDENPDYLQALRGCNLQACGDFELILLPVPLHPQSSVGIMVGYTPEHPRSAPENHHAGELNSALQSFDSLLVSSVSATLAGVANRITNDQMAILGHESAQLIAGIDWMREHYLRDHTAVKQLSLEKADDFCSNLGAFLRNLNFLFDSVKALLTEEIPFNPSEFRAYKEALFKWRDFYRLEAERKNLQLVLDLEGAEDEKRPPVWGDSALIEQLLYNLVNNAVKYCHRGTKILLDCSLASDAGDARHILSVTDYGSDMPDDKRLYELYERGSNAESGRGIGLYLAKRIAERHGGKIGHTSEPISRVNVPLIKTFLTACQEQNCDWATPCLRNMVIEEQCKVQNKLREILALDEHAKPRYQPPLDALNQEDLLKPTYVVKVMVELPRKAEAHPHENSVG